MVTTLKTHASNPHKKSMYCFALLLTYLIASTTYANASIRTQVDRSAISINESLNVQFIANQSIDGDPDFSALNTDFDIINTSQSSSTNIINGSMTRSHVWSLSLFPKRTGTLTIPAIAFGKDMSNAVTITVTQNTPSSSGDQEAIFIEIDASPKNPYVQAQVLFTVRLFLSVDIANGNLSDPQLEASTAILNKLGDDKEYESWRDAKRYRVFERQYVIYPQQSGHLKIDPIHFNARLVQRSRNFFDPFGSSGRMVRISSDAVELNVKPIPKTFTGQNWLPASHLKLTETWAEEPPTFKVGEPITRSITLTAAGLTASQIPEFQQSDIEHFKLYPDKPYTEDQTNQNGITGLRQEKTAIIPTKGGEYILPKIEIPWWNTSTNQLQIAQIPERRVTVVDATPQANNNTDQSTRLTKSTTINNNPEDNAHAQPVGNNAFWKWLSLFLFASWLATALLCWKYKISSKNPGNRTHNTTGNTHKSARQKKSNEVKQAIKKACHHNDMQATKIALLDWASITWPEQSCTSLGQISNRVSGDFKHSIDQLNDALYSKSSNPWEGQALWENFQAIAITKPNNTLTEKTLEPLHKIH